MISPNLYFPVFILSVTFMCVVMSIRFGASSGYEMQEIGVKNPLLPLLLCIVYAVFLGNRGYSIYFGDTNTYILSYMSTDTLSTVSIDWQGEWIWELLTVICRSLGLDYNQYFTMVALIYFLSSFFAVRRLMPDNPMLGMLFVMSSLMFYTFAINGIRNGVACHLVLWGMSYIITGNMPMGILMFGLSFGIHRSVALPIASFIAAMYFIKDIRWVIFGWFGSIVLSLLMGGWFINFFAGLGFDDRMAQYAYDTEFSSSFSSTGFRWDFLLYSFMPVLMTWYIFVKRQISDNWYKVICGTYCLANSFWVLVIRASFSNRFAYLSWFIYPIVIAYPLIMLPVWADQDQKTALILMAYIGFTLLMNIIWHSF